MVNKVDLFEETAFVKVIRLLFSTTKIRHNALLTFFFGFHSTQSLAAPPTNVLISFRAISRLLEMKTLPRNSLWMG